MGPDGDYIKVCSATAEESRFRGSTLLSRAENKPIFSPRSCLTVTCDFLDILKRLCD